MTQPMLVAKLNLLGWPISRETLAKIESQLRWLADIELFCIATAFDISVGQLFPNDARRKTLRWFAGRDPTDL